MKLDYYEELGKLEAAIDEAEKLLEQVAEGLYRQAHDIEVQAQVLSKVRSRICGE